MRYIGNHSGHQVSRLEFTAALAGIAVLVGAFLFKTFTLMVDGERAAFTVQVTNLRVALMLEVASRLTRQGPASMAELQGSNPMTLLGDIPGNYLGPLDAPNAGSIAGGQWYFDTSQGALVYQVRHGRYFRTPLKPPKRARFVIALQFHDDDEDGEYDFGTDRVYGAALQSLDPYEWLLP